MDIPRLTDYLPLVVVLMGTAAVFASMLWLLVFGRRHDATGAWGLLLAALLWVPFNRPVEGPILMRLGHDKGLTVADLFTLAAVLVAAWRLIDASKSEQTIRAKVSADKRL